MPDQPRIQIYSSLTVHIHDVPSKVWAYLFTQGFTHSNDGVFSSIDWEKMIHERHLKSKYPLVGYTLKVTSEFLDHEVRRVDIQISTAGPNEIKSLVEMATKLIQNYPQPT